MYLGAKKKVLLKITDLYSVSIVEHRQPSMIQNVYPYMLIEHVKNMSCPNKLQ